MRPNIYYQPPPPAPEVVPQPIAQPVVVQPVMTQPVQQDVIPMKKPKPVRQDYRYCLLC